MSSEIIWHWDVIIYHVADTVSAAIRACGFFIGLGIAVNGLFRMFGRGK